MKKIIVVLGFLLVLTILFGCTNLADKLTPPKDLHFCFINEDCVIVEGKSCCACPSAINLKFVEYWDSLEFVKCPTPAPLCAGCLSPSAQKAVCINNYCTPVGKE